MLKKIFAVVFLTALSCSSFAQMSEADCQRDCLEGWVDSYLIAMRDDNIDSDLFARDLKFTENGVRLPLGGEGLWFNMSGIGNYKFYIPDIETQQVAFLGTVLQGGSESEEGDLVAIALRLKIVDNKIAEIEQLAIRPDSRNSSNNDFPPTGEGMEAMVAPHEMYGKAIPESQRASRDELIATADYYFEGLQRNDGQGYYPFTDDCERFENGVQTTQTNCKKQFEESLRGIVSRVRDRRFVTVDVERGIVFAFGFFDHHNINWTWQIAELFRIEDAQIRRIEAIFLRAPFGTNSGWSTYEQGMSEEIQNIH